MRALHRVYRGWFVLISAFMILSLAFNNCAKVDITNEHALDTVRLNGEVLRPHTAESDN